MQRDDDEDDRAVEQVPSAVSRLGGVFKAIAAQIPRRLLPADPFTAAAGNPAIPFLYNDKLVGPYIRPGNAMLWCQVDDNGDAGMWTYDPQTPMEFAEVEEILRVFPWKSWQTEDDLAALVSKAGPWLVRFNACRRWFRYLTPQSVKVVEADAIDGDVWRDINCGAYTEEVSKAAHVASAWVRKYLPRIMRIFNEDEQNHAYFEPVLPRYADKDFRLLQLRTSGWGPEVDKSYTGKKIEKMFTRGSKWKRSPHHPFVATVERLIALIDIGSRSGAGMFTFVSPTLLTWTPPVSENDKASARADSYPPEISAARLPVIVYLFARKGADGPYFYIGLGHLNERPTAHVARFLIENAISTETFRAIGVPTGWQLYIEDATASAPRAIRLKKRADIMAAIDGLRDLEKGNITAWRWDYPLMELQMESRHAASLFYRDSDGGGRQHWAPALFGRQRYGKKARRKETFSVDPTTTRVRAADGLKMIGQFVLGNGTLPSPHQWLNIEPPPDQSDNSWELLEREVRKWKMRPPAEAFERMVPSGINRAKPFDRLKPLGRVRDFCIAKSGLLEAWTSNAKRNWFAPDGDFMGEEPAEENECAVRARNQRDGKRNYATITEQGLAITSREPEGVFYECLKSSGPPFMDAKQICFSLNDHILMALTHDGMAGAWDTRTRSQIHLLPAREGRVIAIGFSILSNPIIARMEGDDLVVLELNKPGEEMVRVRIDHPVNDALLFDDAERLAVISEQAVHIWLLGQQREVLAVEGFEAGVASVDAYRKTLLAISPRVGPAIVIDPLRRAQLATLGEDDEILHPVRITPDGDWILAGADEGIRRWRVEDLRKPADVI